MGRSYTGLGVSFGGYSVAGGSSNEGSFLNSNYSAYDLGTNSTRYLTVSENAEAIDPNTVIRSESIITRLGEGVDESGSISGQAVDRVIQCLKQFDKRVRDDDSRWIGGIATSACRRADSKSVEQFFDSVEEVTGTRPELITGLREAELTGRGVLASLPNFDSGVVVDIGGGSTEWIVLKDSRVKSVESLETGVVTLFERCVQGDCWKEQFGQCVNRNLANVFDRDLPGEEPLIVVGGTGTTFSSLVKELSEYDSESVHGHVLTREQIEGELDQMKSVTFDELSNRAPIKDGREDVIIPGGLILLWCMDELSTNEVVVSDHGILAGFCSGRKR